jgi:4-amino-4-deoxy-L-arabinose transferase-like glycosyltransferase
MFRMLNCRAGHYALLMLTWAALCLPNLGGPSLWDIDEGNNSEAAREMWCADNWIVPTCNYRLREDKPALLYWLQGAGYAVFGAGEFAARLPSAVAALAAVLATYELGRRMFNAAAGLLAGLLLGAAVLFCAAAHFANPDSLLNACSLFALFFFWRDYAAGRTAWSPWSAAAAGLGVLAKGPVGLILPMAVSLVFLLWRWQLGRLWSARFLTSLAAFLLVAAPWYVWVTVETKGAWTAGFWLHHNQDRFLGKMEGHGGPFFYYALVLIAGCAPWGVFLGLTAWYAAVACLRARSPSPLAGEGQGGGDGGSEAIAAPRPTAPAQGGSGDNTGNTLRDPAPDDRPAIQFLVCWFAVYFVFFSASGTKLPNYILPLYPAVALATGWCLDRWRRGEVRPPVWLIGVGLALLALVGVGTAAALLIVGGVLPVPGVRRFPGLEAYAVLGAPLLVGAAVAAWRLFRRADRDGALVAVLAASLLFTASLDAWGAGAVDAWRAPRALAAALPPDQTRREVRVGAFAYFQPSMIFYCRREVVNLKTEEDALAFLKGPLPSYLFVPAEKWRELEARAAAPHRLIARRPEFYEGGDVVVVTNDVAGQ